VTLRGKMKVGWRIDVGSSLLIGCCCREAIYEYVRAGLVLIPASVISASPLSVLFVPRRVPVPMLITECLWMFSLRPCFRPFLRF
jgi:hypothetical protein